MIIDGSVLITGSFNFTKAADENNSENVVVIPIAGVAAQYEQNWQSALPPFGILHAQISFPGMFESTSPN